MILVNTSNSIRKTAAKRASVLLATLVAVTLGAVSTAAAHDPIILLDTQTTPDAGPLLPDGTISFALYGTVTAAGDTRGLRVRFAAGDTLARFDREAIEQRVRECPYGGVRCSRVRKNGLIISSCDMREGKVGCS